MYLVFAIIGGIAFSLQAAANSALSERAGKIGAAAVTFISASIISAVLVFSLGSNTLGNIKNVSWWQLLGGLYSVYICIIGCIVFPVIGATMTSASGMLGQLIMSLIIDFFGLLGVSKVSDISSKLISIVIIVSGVLITYSEKKVTGTKNWKSKQTLFLLLAVSSGIAGALQIPTNSALATQVGNIESAFVSFTTGMIIIVVVWLVKKPHVNSDCIVKSWMFIGGLCGVIGVFSNIVTLPFLGSSLVSAAGMLGQLSCGMAIDSTGIMQANKMKLSRNRIIGIVLIAIGILFDNFMAF